MGPAPTPAPTSTPAVTRHFRPPLPNTNPNIRKDNAVKERKRVAPKRFRPAAPKPTAAHLPLPEASPKPKNDVPDTQPVPVHESTPQLRAGKMSGNLFTDRNWLLPPNYLSNENKTVNEPKNTAGITGPRPPLQQEEEPKINAQEKCGWGPDFPFCKSQKKEEENKEQQKMSPKVPKPQAKRPDTLNPNMTKEKQQWETEMERLNSKYNLDCFLDSELHSEPDKGEQYQYEHGYETLI